MIVFTGGQVRPSPACPTLITWIRDEEPALRVLPGCQDIPPPIIPRYEEGWLQKPGQEWDRQGLLDKVSLEPTGASDTTMLILNGPPTNPENLDSFFEQVAAATELAVKWKASDSQLEEWCARLIDVEPPLTPRTKALVRWIAAMDHIANP